MDISFFSNAGAAFASENSLLQGLQQQLSTGEAVPDAAANPAAYTGGLRDTSEVQLLGAEQGSQINIESQLNIATSTLGQANTVLDQIQSITLQAINGTTSGQDYQALSEQVGQAAQSLIGLANTQGANGNYLFAGTAQGTEPFVPSSSGAIEYVGNDGVSTVQISPGVSVNSAVDGSIFMSGFSGNGYASVTAQSTNTGTATVLAIGASDQSLATAFQQGSQPITVGFTTAADGSISYIAQEAGSVISSGPITDTSDGAMLTISGMQFQVSGTPANGDSFTIAPGRPQSVFGIASEIQSSLASPGSTPAQRAQVRQVLGNALGAIAQYQQRLSGASTKIGVVLNAATEAGTSDQTLSTSAQTDRSNLVSANIPQTIAEIEEQQTALQASYKAFSSAASLSLFQYLA